MGDYIVRALSAEGFVKAAAIRSTEMVRRGRQIHKTTPTATAALGRALTAASLMGNMQKVENGSVTLQIKGGGPLGTILCVADAIGNVRGYVQNPGISLLEKYPGKLDVGAAVGTDGMLTVARDLQMKEPYVGSVALVSGEIAEDVTAYFAQSEQTPTACALGVLIDRDQSVQVAGGYLIQLLPEAPKSVAERLERGIQEAGAVTAMLAQGLTPEQMLQTVCAGMDVEFLETTPVAYRCYCSRERVTSALISLGEQELHEIAEKGETVEVGCQFCDTTYAFDPTEIKGLVQKLRAGKRGS